MAIAPTDLTAWSGTTATRKSKSKPFWWTEAIRAEQQRNTPTIKITKAVPIIIPPLTPDIISNRPTSPELPPDGSVVSESVTLAVGSGKSTSRRVLEVGLSRIDPGGGVLDPPLGSIPLELGGLGPSVLVVGSASSYEVVGSDSTEVVVVKGEGTGPLISVIGWGGVWELSSPARRPSSLSASAEVVAEAETAQTVVLLSLVTSSVLLTST
ncbi:hypothetical protein TWF970_007198 [Orbilia oligospora]|uniref:Uncharacterized protein n=1 Tax=Orbilia oligospora TaxID=2813651 RepID=A0A7C8VWW8_ORBOL|nr:hypothetical protein TWF970_007198 [Orbilia oligospora]